MFAGRFLDSQAAEVDNLFNPGLNTGIPEILSTYPVKTLEILVKVFLKREFVDYDFTNSKYVECKYVQRIIESMQR